MLKKTLQLVILLIVLWSIVFWIYKNPELILQKETQDRLLDVADRIDTSIEDLKLQEKFNEWSEDLKDESTTDQEKIEILESTLLVD